MIDATFTDPITVNLSIGYGELTVGSTVYSLTNGAAESAATGGASFSYSQIRSLLAGEVSSDVLSGVQALPDAAAVQGQSSVVVWAAEEKALGLLPANASALDGAAGFATDISSSLLEGVALHELTHAMGRVLTSGSQADVLDLDRFSSPGVHVFGQSQGPTAYFSLDGGATPLADYGQGSDPADFLNSAGLTPNDAFNEYYSSGTLQQFSPVDLLQMEALGFHAAAPTGPVAYTAAPNYTAPAGVTTIYLQGTSQTVTANNAGDTVWSNDTGNTLFGGTGNDVFHLGRGGDWAAGGGGDDVFAFAGVPWAGAHIADFGAGDMLDLTGLMSTTADTGFDGFADGYLTIVDDGQGDAQILAENGASGWSLVATLQGVAPSSLQHSGDMIFLGVASTAPAATTVTTADADYTAPGAVTSITLTGSQQHIDASATNGVTINSNDSGNVLIGGPGNDVFHLGRGGDWAAGGGGDDVFTLAGVPWTGAHIADFSAGDMLDLTGLMSTTADTGFDGFADGYLAISDDGQGDAQVWAESGGSGGWSLAATLQGVASSNVQHSGDMIFLGVSSTAPATTAVATADADYAAPGTVTAIILTGSQQHIDASAVNGVTINSNDSGNVLIGGAGNDTFHLGRGGDWVTGGAGADTFAYAATPWAGGGITDFNPVEGDRLDVSGLLQASRYSGSDPFADGYLKLTTDSGGNAQLWSDTNPSGNDGWWLVTTLDGVSTSSLHYAGGLIT